jgi:hypothetical protein
LKLDGGTRRIMYPIRLFQWVVRKTDGRPFDCAGAKLLVAQLLANHMGTLDNFVHVTLLGL